MANYRTMTEAVNAGLTNMTILRNHVRNDVSTVNYPTGIDWFKFNGNTVSRIYSAGDSWLGFYSNTKHLQINQRDSAVWDELKETGMVGNLKFFKFTWKGTSGYYASYENKQEYQQYYDVFLLSDGRIYLNYYQVATALTGGVNKFACGSESISIPVTPGVPCEYTFTPSDPISGTGWSMEPGRPEVYSYKTYGEAEYEFDEIHSITNVDWSDIVWSADVPEGTSLTIYARLDDDPYEEMESGGSLPIERGTSLEESTLYIKAVLTTEDISVTPSLISLHIRIRDVLNRNTLILRLPLGNPHSIQNAIGEVTLVYDGSGGLIGLGGSVASFRFPFTPENLEVKPHQHDVEHIEVTEIEATGRNIQLVYSDYKSGDEHFEVTGITGNGQRIYIGDI